MSDSVSYTLLSILLILLGIIVTLVLGYYADFKTQKAFVHVTCFLSFFFSASIIVVLPLDLVSTRFRECSAREIIVSDCVEPVINVSRDFLYGFWYTTYVFTFVLSVFVVPVMQGYVRSGAFHFRGRLYEGIMENINFYALCGIGGIALILYALFGLHIPASLLISLVIPAANAYGLIFLILFLSYGLVQLPRSLWYYSNSAWVLTYLESQVPSIKETSVDSESELYEIARQLANASRKIPQNDELRPFLETVLQRCPLAMDARGVSDNDDGLTTVYTRLVLKDLNRRIIRSAFVTKRDEAVLKSTLNQAFILQDIIANHSNPSKRINSVFLSIADTDKYKDLKLQAYWWWYVWIKPISMRALAVLCAIASLIILWSESTFQFDSHLLSIPQILLSPGALDHATLELVALLFICYMCACSYSTILQLKIFDMFQVVPNHHTDEVSMLFVALNFCRLTFPLSYNFLNMAGLANGKKASNGVDYSESPVFIQYLGPAVNLTPLLGEGYNDWMPYLILILAIVFLLNLHGKILRLLRVKNYFYETIKSDAETQEGKQILAQARILEERRIQRGVGEPGSSSVPQARNAAELLARYKAKKTPGLESIAVISSGSKSKPVNDEPLKGGFLKGLTGSGSKPKTVNDEPLKGESSKGSFLKGFTDFVKHDKSRSGFAPIKSDDESLPDATHLAPVSSKPTAPSRPNVVSNEPIPLKSTTMPKPKGTKNIFD